MRVIKANTDFADVIAFIDAAFYEKSKTIQSTWQKEPIMHNGDKYVIVNNELLPLLSVELLKRIEEIDYVPPTDEIDG